MTSTVSGRTAPEVGGIVLSGGGAVRIQGADKASIEVGGATLLEHALQALVDLPDVVVVGEQVPTSRPVTFVREDPPGGGPAAGLLAGLAGFPRRPRLVVVLAVDMPLVTDATVRRLLTASTDDGALLVDGEGRRQYLCAVYATQALSEAAPPPGEEHGLAVRALVESLDLGEVAAVDGEAQDIDTWDDLLGVRDRLGP